MRASRVRRTHHWGWTVAAYVALCIFVIWTIVPFAWMLLTSLKTNKQIYEQALLLPASPFFGHYAKLATGPFPTYVKNSALVAGCITACSIGLGVIAAYSITRLRFRGRGLVAQSLVVTYLLPSSLLFIPLFAVVAALGLINSLASLLLTYLTFTVPFCTWMLVGYFKGVPRELEEAALMDGCGRLGALLHVTLPLCLPAIVVVGLFSFTLAWNEFLYALVLIHSMEMRTATVGLTSMVGDDVFFWGQMMAGALLTALPPVALYTLAQRLVVQGLMAGGLRT